MVGLGQGFETQIPALVTQLAANPQASGEILGEMLGNFVLNAYPSAQNAFAMFAATGNTAPLIIWAETYLPLGVGLAEGATSLAEAGAEAVTTDAGALAEEAPAWAAEGEALGVPVEQIEAAAEESAALNVAAEAEEAAATEGVVAPLTDPVEAAQANLTEEIAHAETTVEQTTAAGDLADGGQLAQAEVVEAQANALARQTPGMDAAAAAEQATAAVQLAEQTCQDQLDGGCFTSGTPLLTPEGAVAVERLCQGDKVLSRSQDAPDGPVETREVVEVYRRLAAVWEIGVRGRMIGATAEHPFYVRDKGWTPARLIGTGDWLRSHDGEWVTVEGVRETDEVVVVYNVQVAEYHTYFVGGLEWGFSVWAHNVCKLTPELQEVRDQLTDSASYRAI